jgi:hypothetical protein
VRELVDAPAESMSDALRLLFDLEPVGVAESPADRATTTM